MNKIPLLVHNITHIYVYIISRCALVCIKKKKNHVGCNYVECVDRWNFLELNWFAFHSNEITFDLSSHRITYVRESYLCQGCESRFGVGSSRWHFSRDICLRGTIRQTFSRVQVHSCGRTVSREPYKWYSFLRPPSLHVVQCRAATTTSLSLAAVIVCYWSRTTGTQTLVNVSLFTCTAV